MKQITLNQTVRISDPCYDKANTDHIFLFQNVKSGKFNVECERSDEGAWGMRNAKLRVIHTDHQDSRLYWTHQGYIAVDSGQAGIFDEQSYRNDYYSNSIKTPSGSWAYAGHFDSEEGGKFYDKMCSLTLMSPEGWGTYDRGVVSSSGFGDGSYSVYIAQDDKKNIVGIEIAFIEEEEEEEEEEEYNFEEEDEV